MTASVSEAFAFLSWLLPAFKLKKIAEEIKNRDAPKPLREIKKPLKPAPPTTKRDKQKNNYLSPMKILFGIQGTGNGHVSRARDIIPHLQKYAEVDILISGTQVDVTLAHEIKYRKKGLSFIFGKHGGVDFQKTLKGLSLGTLANDILSLDLKPYDFILNDFEPVSAWAGKLKNKKVIALSHQSAFLSEKSPRPPKINSMAEKLFKYYAPCNSRFSFHFESYDENIFTPIIRREIRELIPTVNNHYTVYLPAYDDKFLLKYLKAVPDVQWEIFSKHEKIGYTIENVRVRPIDNQSFNQSVASCSGLLTGAGFEAPAEAMFLGKKVMALPMKGQYEQYCNAEAMRRMGISVVHEIDDTFVEKLKEWCFEKDAIKVDFPDNVAEVVQKIFC